MKEGSRAVQYWSALAVTLTMIYQGTILGWPSPVLPKLLGNETNVVITKAECSWVVSMVTIGGIPGSVMSRYLSDVIGRKNTILVAAIPCLAGSIITIFAKVPYLLYIARLLNGMGGAMAVVVVSIYVTEIADKEIRGALGTLMTSMSNVGNLIMYCVGPFVPYTVLNSICAVIPVIFLVACIWIPESPYYYFMVGNLSGAEKSMKSLKGVADIKPIENEYNALQMQVQRDMERKTSISELMRKKEYRRGVLVTAGLKILQQLTGAIAVQSYLETIFRSTSMELSGSTVSIIYGVVQFFAGIIATVLIDKAGRKPLLFVSSLGCGLSHMLVGIYFFIQNYMEADAQLLKAISPMPVVGIIGFNILFAVGIGNIPYVMQGELFPTNVKSAASSAATMFGAMIAFVVAKSFQGLVDALGIYSVFWIFAGVCFGGVFFVYFCVPETKGKSLADIQVKLHRLRKLDKNIVKVETEPLRDESR